MQPVPRRAPGQRNLFALILAQGLLRLKVMSTSSCHPRHVEFRGFKLITIKNAE